MISAACKGSKVVLKVISDKNLRMCLPPLYKIAMCTICFYQKYIFPEYWNLLPWCPVFYCMLKQTINLAVHNHSSLCSLFSVLNTSTWMTHYQHFHFTMCILYMQIKVKYIIVYLKPENNSDLIMLSPWSRVRDTFRWIQFGICVDFRWTLYSTMS